jgi:integrase
MVRMASMRAWLYASWLIANGESLVYVKEQLGHHFIQITVDTYGHLILGANRKAVNALDDPGWDMGTETHPENSILRAISE